MWQKRLLVGVSVLFLSGCSLPMGGGIAEGGSIWKSQDAGMSFEPKGKIDETQSIARSDILSFEFRPGDPETIYLGTMESGLFKTTNGAETWQKLEYPPIKVYGLAVDPIATDRVYATGVYEGIGKIYRSDDGGQKWQEIYTEPVADTVITALALSPDNPGTLVAGTSVGVVIETRDGGATWKNLYHARGPVTEVLMEKGLPGMRTLLVWNQGTIVSHDAGTNWQDNTALTASYANYTGSPAPLQPQNLTVLVPDPANSAILYGGASNGLFKSADRGKTWQSVNIIESSRTVPVRAIAINPASSKEIIYGAGSVLYKSNDSGASWATTNLLIERGMGVLKYHPGRPEVIYFTLREY